MKKLVFILIISIQGCANVTEPDLSTSAKRLQWLLQGLSELQADEDVFQYCFQGSVFGKLESSEQYLFYMACGNELYSREEYLKASMEFLFATFEKGITKQQTYDAMMGEAYASLQKNIGLGPLFLVQLLEEKNIEYGPEAVVLNLKATKKSGASCFEVKPLVAKLIEFENWKTFMSENSLANIQKMCGKI